jgi:hypothetical protein
MSKKSRLSARDRDRIRSKLTGIVTAARRSGDFKLAGKIEKFVASSRHFDRFMDKMYTKWQADTGGEAAGKSIDDFLKFVLEFIDANKEEIMKIILAIIKMLVLVCIMFAMAVPSYSQEPAKPDAVQSAAQPNPLTIPLIIPLPLGPSGPVAPNDDGEPDADNKNNVFHLEFKQGVKAGRMLVMRAQNVPAIENTDIEVGYVVYPPPMDDDFQLHENGHVVNFTSPPSADGSPVRYMLIATVNNPVAGAPPLRCGYIIEFVGGTVPPPNNPDVPVVPVVPVTVPDDEYKAAKSAYEAAIKLPADLRALSPKIGEAYASAADGLDSGQFANATAALEWLGTERTKIAGSSSDQWRNVALDIGKVFESEWARRNSMTKDQVSDFLRYVSVGLKAVK